ncbi:uncharacterized protein F5147DRAFT_560984, partial [Suillus discolor]
MSTVNASTGVVPFQLQLGRMLQMLPPLVQDITQAQEPEETRAHSLMNKLNIDLMEAQDSLITSKASQANSVNKKQSPQVVFKEGDHVMLANRRQ